MPAILKLLLSSLSGLFSKSLIAYILTALVAGGASHWLSETFYAKELNKILSAHVEELRQEVKTREFVRDYNAKREKDAYDKSQLIVESLLSHIDNLEVVTNVVEKEIIRYIKEPTQANNYSCNLDDNVRLLLEEAIGKANSYRADSNKNTPIPVEKIQTNSSLTRQDIVTAYLRLIEQYGGLAASHDSLVDYLNINYLNPEKEGK